MNCNLYKVQIGKLQSVYHLHVLQFFFTEFSQTLFSMQTSSESLVSVVCNYVVQQTFMIIFPICNRKCARFFFLKKYVWDSLSGCFHQFVSFLMHALKSLLYPFLKKKKGIWKLWRQGHIICGWCQSGLSMIFENLDPRVYVMLNQSGLLIIFWNGYFGSICIAFSNSKGFFFFFLVLNSVLLFCYESTGYIRVSEILHWLIMKRVSG